MLSSLDNPKIKQLLKLKQAKYRKQMGLFIAEGTHLVEEAKMTNCLIEAFSIEERPDMTQISSAIMKKIVETDTLVKCIGLCKKPNHTNIGNKVLILDGIQDPGNMGTLIRSACAFNFMTIMLSNDCVDIYNSKVLRATQGAIFKVNFIFGNINDLAAKLADYTIYKTEVDGQTMLDKVKFSERIAIILGNEGSGLSEASKKLNCHSLTIPMDNMESLNVAVAGSIIMYHLK